MKTYALSVYLQRFFTERLGAQMEASPNTIASYRDTFRLLLRYAADQRRTEPTALQIVPSAPVATASANNGAAAVYEYEPEPGEILSDLIPRNIAVQVFRALLENAAGEMAPR